MVKNRIKMLRKEQGLTQKDIADFLGVTPKAVSFYELEQREPSNEMLQKLAKKFNVSVDYLLGADEILNIATPKTKKIPKDLKKILEDEAITLNGRLVSEEDKEKMMRILEAAFYEAKEMNRRK